jgi:hypothetical protein
MKSFDASAGSPTKKYVVIVDLNPIGTVDVTSGVGVVEAGATGVEVAGTCPVTTDACGVGGRCAHTANAAASTAAIVIDNIMDKGFMVGHSSNLATL